MSGHSREELRARLIDVGVQFNQAAEDLFSDLRFQPSEQAAEVKVTARSVSDLGLSQGADYVQITERAKEMGLAECPLELAAYLRVQYLDQPVSSKRPKDAEPGSPPGALTVASAPLDDSDETPKGFYLRNIDGTLWLRGYWSDALHSFHPDDVFVFVCGRLGTAESSQLQIDSE
jgi:hypothetical protein